MLSFKEILIAILVTGITLLVTTYPSRIAPFNIEDDHFYIKISQPEIGYFKEYESAEKYSSFLEYFKSFGKENGRFFPLLKTSIWLLAKTSHLNPVGVQAILFLFGWLSAILFFILLRILLPDFLIPLLFSLVFITGRYAAIWYRCTGELFALPFLLLCFISMILYFRNNKKIFLASGICSLFFSCLFKESFPALIPAVCFSVALLYVFEKQTSLRYALKQTKWFQFSALMIFLMTFAGILFALNSGDKSPVSFLSMHHILHNFIFLSGYYYTTVPIIIYVVFLVWNNKFRNIHLYILFAWLCWLSSQMVIYSKMEITPYARYQMPAVLFSIVLAAVSFYEIKKLKVNYLNGLIILFLAGACIVNAKNTYMNSTYYSARAMSYDNMLDVLVSKVNPLSDKILMIAEDGREDGFLESTVTYLSLKGLNMPMNQVIYIGAKKNGDVFIHQTPELVTKLYLNKTLTRKEDFVSEIRKDSAIKWIVFCRPIENNFLNSEDFRFGFKNSFDFSQPYLYISTKEIFQSMLGEDFPKHRLTFRIFER